MTETGRTGCVRVGCWGCGGSAAALLLVVLVLVAIAAGLGVPEESFVEPALVRELPGESEAAPRAPAEAPPTAAQPPGTAATDAAPRPGWRAPGVDEVPGTPSGRVVLDLSMGEFTIVPGPAGEPARVEGRFDDGSYALTETLETRDDGSWEYRVSFGRRISWVRQIFGVEAHNRLRIVLPRGVPFALSGRIGIGQSRLELGGLSLTDVELDTGVGEHRLSFDAPVPGPLRGVRVDGSTGELWVTGLGNASPREVRLRQSVGVLRVGLRGEWRGDATIEARHRIGELRVALPDAAVEVDLVRADLALGDKNLRALRARSPAPAGAPTLRLSVSSLLGEVAVAD